MVRPYQVAPMKGNISITCTSGRPLRWDLLVKVTLRIRGRDLRPSPSDRAGAEAWIRPGNVVSRLLKLRRVEPASGRAIGLRRSLSASRQGGPRIADRHRPDPKALIEALGEVGDGGRKGQSLALRVSRASSGARHSPMLPVIRAAALWMESRAR